MTHTTIDGIDVSDYQREVPWPAVHAASYEFGIAKATESVGFTCSTFARNWAGIKAAGMVRGAYHFARPSQNRNPKAEVDYFLAAIDAAGGLETGDAIALDLEDTNVSAYRDLATWTLGWLQYAMGQVGFRPLLYSGEWYLKPHNLLSNTEIASSGLWLAAYGRVRPEPPDPWPFVAIWQRDAWGDVPGIDGDCDLNTFFGTREQLLRYGKPDKEPTP